MAPRSTTSRAITRRATVTPEQEHQAFLKLQAHLERRKLIEKPFPQIHYHGKSQPWAGVLIVRELPGETRRRTSPREYDELAVSVEDLVTLSEA